MKPQSDILRIRKAFDALDVLNTKAMRNYREVLLDLNLKEERNHRKHETDAFALTVRDAAKLHSVVWIARYLSNAQQMPALKGILSLRSSCIYAAACVDQYGAELLTALTPHDIGYLADLDYAELVCRKSG